MIFNIEELGKTFPVAGSAMPRQGVDDLELLPGRIRSDTIFKTVRFFPCARVDDHLAILQPPENHSFARFVVAPVIFDVHEKVGIEL